MSYLFPCKLRHKLQKAVLPRRQLERPDPQGALMGQDGILPSREGALALLEGGSGDGGRRIHVVRTTKGGAKGDHIHQEASPMSDINYQAIG